MINCTEETFLINGHINGCCNTNNLAKTKSVTVTKFLYIVACVFVFVFILILLSIKSDNNSIAIKNDPDESMKKKRSALIAQHELVHNLNSLKTYASAGCESTVLIIRHCEKQSLIDSSNYYQEHCNTIGFQRARFLATLFGNNVEDRWPIPSYLYALSPDKHLNIFREIETLQPLSDKIHIPIISDYGPLDTANLAHKIFDDLRRGKLCNKLVVVCWNHSDIPNLAQKLSCGPLNGCLMKYPGHTFDDAWQINYVYRPPLVTNNEIPSINEGWEVFGSVVKEGFDPLHFTKIEKRREL